jgi:hypothetical protein
VIRVFEHVVVAVSCSIHWPGEYPPTTPSPHSLNALQVGDTETGLSVAVWASQVTKIMLATQKISHQVEYITCKLVPLDAVHARAWMGIKK